MWTPRASGSAGRPMAEEAGHPRDWEAFSKNLRERAKKALGVTLWRYLYPPDRGFYGDLAFTHHLGV